MAKKGGKFVFVKSGKKTRDLKPQYSRHTDSKEESVRFTLPTFAEKPREFREARVEGMIMHKIEEVEDKTDRIEDKLDKLYYREQGDEEKEKIKQLKSQEEKLMKEKDEWQKRRARLANLSDEELEKEYNSPDIQYSEDYSTHLHRIMNKSKLLEELNEDKLDEFYNKIANVGEADAEDIYARYKDKPEMIQNNKHVAESEYDDITSELVDLEELLEDNREKLTSAEYSVLKKKFKNLYDYCDDHREATEKDYEKAIEIASEESLVSFERQLGFPEKIFKKGDRVVYDNPESTKLGTLGKIVGTKGEYAIIKLDTGRTVKTHTTFVKKPLKTLIGKKQWR